MKRPHIFHSWEYFDFMGAIPVKRCRTCGKIKFI